MKLVKLHGAAFVAVVVFVASNASEIAADCDKFQPAFDCNAVDTHDCWYIGCDPEAPHEGGTDHSGNSYDAKVDFGGPDRREISHESVDCTRECTCDEDPRELSICDGTCHFTGLMETCNYYDFNCAVEWSTKTDYSYEACEP